MKNKKIFTIVTLVLTATLLVMPLYAVSAQTLIWTGNVYSSGALVTGPILESGKNYLIVAYEIFWYDYENNLAADAQYYTTSALDHWNWENYLPAPDGHSFLQVDGADQDWGPFSNGDSGHTYYLNYVGTGAEVTFQIIDWIDGSGNNVCHFPIRIFECEDFEYAGLTPGFWKNHVDLWTGYDTNDLFSDDEIFDVLITINQGKKTEVSDPTLLEALCAKGGVNEKKGVCDALARHAVAALLNAAHPDVNYPLSTEEVIEKVNYAITNGGVEALKNELQGYNSLGGGIDAHGNAL